MREIKFRGKTKQGEWKYGLLTYANFNHGVELAIAVKSELGAIWIERINKDTISQFTGLYSKNGKEIYEGDIVSLNKDLLGSYVVKYDVKNTRFSMYRDNYEQAGFNLETMKNYEVIGNIYDTPELVKE